MTRIVPVTSKLPIEPHQQAQADQSSRDSGEKAVLVQIYFGRTRDEESLNELDLLARSAGAIPVARVVGSRRSPDPGLFIGKGKVEEIRQAVTDHGATLVLINHSISPVQERNLESWIFLPPGQKATKVNCR